MSDNVSMQFQVSVVIVLCSALLAAVINTWICMMPLIYNSFDKFQNSITDYKPYVLKSVSNEELNTMGEGLTPQQVIRTILESKDVIGSIVIYDLFFCSSKDLNSVEEVKVEKMFSDKFAEYGNPTIYCSMALAGDIPSEHLPDVDSIKSIDYTGISIDSALKTISEFSTSDDRFKIEYSVDTMGLYHVVVYNSYWYGTFGNYSGGSWNVYDIPTSSTMNMMEGNIFETVTKILKHTHKYYRA